jgi:SPP1 gp7 family putative phage head morphogenesis protein
MLAQSDIFKFYAFASAGAPRRDPTQTTLLRRRFEMEIKRKIRTLKKAIRAYVLANLQPDVKANAEPFEFGRSANKVGAFMQWLEAQNRKGLLQTVSGTSKTTSARGAWSNLYIRSAYQTGIQRSANNLKVGGVRVNPPFVDGAFNRPIHADAVGLIYTRTYNDLEGITGSMAGQMSSILASGIANGEGALAIAKGLEQIADMTSIRAQRIARTEVIRAFSDSTLNTYKEAGIDDVNVLAEFSTAGDGQVCPECQALEGKVFSVSEASGVIPVHPNCRCAWLPVVHDDAKGSVLG